MLEHFHNTINASGDTLVAHTITCKSQEERILVIFKEKQGVAMTPFYVADLYSKLYKEVPITSIRRAMSNLTEENKLIKLPSMREEKYGKPNFLWKYNDSFGK